MRLQMQTTSWWPTPSISATTDWISVGILRGGVDDHLAVLAGIGDRGLRLEIELLLAAAVERAAEAVGGGGEFGVAVAVGDAARQAEEALLGD